MILGNENNHQQIIIILFLANFSGVKNSNNQFLKIANLGF